VFKDTGGNIVMVFGLSLPVLLGGAALAVDGANLYRQEASLQNIADSVALATAKEIHVFGSTDASLVVSGKSRAEAMLAEAELGGNGHTVSIEVDKKTGSAKVDIAFRSAALLPVSYAENPIKVSANARAYGQISLCVLVLNPADAATLNSKGLGVVSGPTCAVQSNSNSPEGLVVETGGTIVAKQTCSSGGVVGPASSFLPDPARTDCPAITDPLSSRTPPTFGTCDHNKFAVKSGTKTIYPGVYCGGIEIANKAAVVAEPGVYVIKGGSLVVGQEATLKGSYVGFYFADDKALLAFKDSSVVDLSAPKEGPMSGILFFENPSASLGRKFVIGSTNVKRLLGTIYLPRGILAVDAKGSIAAESAYTVVIANKLDLKEAKLVLNTDFGLSDVPLPEGVPAGPGFQGQSVWIAK
jgi:Flp pilus assembly protein TadG